MTRLYIAFFQIVIGFFIADVIVGMFHWFEDTYLDYCITFPILSEISKDNELHHYFPRSITAHSYIDNIKIPFSITILVFACLFIVNRYAFFKYPYFFASLAFFGISANVLHRHSHMRECENPVIINWLQKCGILCSHSHHSAHHEKIMEKYCVITEYNNYVLDRIYFWRILENIVYIFTGITPSRKMAYDDYYEIHNHMHQNAKLECPDKPTKEDVEELKRKLKNYKKCEN